VALGGAIRRTRSALAISQERLALLAEVDRSYVGRIERGDNAVAVLTLIKIAAALDITASALMEAAGL
jgi:transcriptional regulator with XRE-family HTH domain